MNNLSRNTPVALVVGAAGFLGSHLAEKLLDKNIQVVGIDDLSTGKSENFLDASKNKNFHFIRQSAVEKIDFDFPRIDYAFFAVSPHIAKSSFENSFDNFLEVTKKYNSKIVLISSVELYDNHGENSFNLKLAENKLAKFSADNKLNARVVRLTNVFGPRMNFCGNDPINRLILSAAKDNLQKEITALDFSTRSLYIKDAVDLLIKTVMHGATAQKIYDGALPVPIKISEIKQVLLDPLWHESRGFEPTELPPWPTPNLEKTMKELSWKPCIPIVQALKETLHFFKEKPEYLKEELKTNTEIKVQEEEKNILKDEKREMLAEIYGKKEVKRTGEEHKDKKNSREAVFIWKPEHTKKTKKYSLLITLILLVSIGLIYPLVSLGISILNINNHLKKSIEFINESKLEEAVKETELVKREVGELKKFSSPLILMEGLDFLRINTQLVSQSINFLNQISNGVSSYALGVKDLSMALKVISGEVEGDSSVYFRNANSEFTAAEKDFSFIEFYPEIIKEKVKNLGLPLSEMQQMVSSGRIISVILSQVIDPESKKDYLVLLQDNTVLRPGGGVIRAYANLSFNQGKLEAIKADKISILDAKLTEAIEPPTELKSDLGISSWSLRNSNYESDFPANGRLMQWFYNKESGINTSGVIVLDFDGVARILSAIGPLTIEGQKETINANNLVNKALIAEDKEKYSSLILNELLNRIFFLSSQKWINLGESLGQAVKEKHLLFYASESSLFSLLQSQNWTGLIPRPVKEEKGEKNTFLGIFETNLKDNEGSLKLTKIINLEDKIQSNNKALHKLSINYTNSDTSSNKVKLKIYLSSGSKLLSAYWGKEDILKKVGNFSDYGRAGYMVVLELQPNEQKSLVLSLEEVEDLSFAENLLKYQLKLVKQPGSSKSNFTYDLKYPESIKLITGETNYSTELSSDKTLDIFLQKQKPL